MFWKLELNSQFLKMISCFSVSSLDKLCCFQFNIFWIFIYIYQPGSKHLILAYPTRFKSEQHEHIWYDFYKSDENHKCRQLKNQIKSFLVTHLSLNISQIASAVSFLLTDWTTLSLVYWTLKKTNLKYVVTDGMIIGGSSGMKPPSFVHNRSIFF